MSEIKRILVPIDGSEISERAVQQAVNLAKANDAVIDFLYVANITGVMSGQQMTANVFLPELVLDAATKTGDAILERTMSKLPAGVAANTHCEAGNPSTVILEFAGDLNSDLIIMGTRGLGAIKGMLLGSVSQNIIERAKCPVMVVK